MLDSSFNSKSICSIYIHESQIQIQGDPTKHLTQTHKQLSVISSLVVIICCFTAHPLPRNHGSLVLSQIVFYPVGNLLDAVVKGPLAAFHHNPAILDNIQPKKRKLEISTSGFVQIESLFLTSLGMHHREIVHSCQLCQRRWEGWYALPRPKHWKAFPLSSKVASTEGAQNPEWSLRYQWNGPLPRK